MGQRFSAARKTLYRGVLYDSAGEAAVAQKLDQLMATTPPLVESWTPWPAFELLPRVPGQRASKTRPFIATLPAMRYTPDFRVVRAVAARTSGADPAAVVQPIVYVEFKGRFSSDFRLRLRLMRQMHPEVDLQVITDPDDIVRVVMGESVRAVRRRKKAPDGARAGIARLPVQPAARPARRTSRRAASERPADGADTPRSAGRAEKTRRRAS